MAAVGARRSGRTLGLSGWDEGSRWGEEGDNGTSQMSVQATREGLKRDWAGLSSSWREGSLGSGEGKREGESELEKRGKRGATRPNERTERAGLSASFASRRRRVALRRCTAPSRDAPGC